MSESPIHDDLAVQRFRDQMDAYEMAGMFDRGEAACSPVAQLLLEDDQPEVEPLICRACRHPESDHQIDGRPVAGCSALPVRGIACRCMGFRRPQ